MPGNILACPDTSHSLGDATTSVWLIGMRDAAKHLQCSGQHPAQRMILLQKVNSEKMSKPILDLDFPLITAHTVTQTLVHM